MMQGVGFQTFENLRTSVGATVTQFLAKKMTSKIWQKTIPLLLIMLFCEREET
jgi:hypothetical protein